MISDPCVFCTGDGELEDREEHWGGDSDWRREVLWLAEMVAETQQWCENIEVAMRRTWCEKGREDRRERDETRREVEEMKRFITATRKELEDVRGEMRRVKEEIDNTRKEMRCAEEVQNLKEEMSTTEKEVCSLRSEVCRVDQEMQRVREELCAVCEEMQAAEESNETRGIEQDKRWRSVERSIEELRRTHMVCNCVKSGCRINENMVEEARRSEERMRLTEERTVKMVDRISEAVEEIRRKQDDEREREIERTTAALVCIMKRR